MLIGENLQIGFTLRRKREGTRTIRNISWVIMDINDNTDNIDQIENGLFTYRNNLVSTGDATTILCESSNESSSEMYSEFNFNEVT